MIFCTDPVDEMYANPQKEKRPDKIEENNGKIHNYVIPMVLASLTKTMVRNMQEFCMNSELEYVRACFSQKYLADKGPGAET